VTRHVGSGHDQATNVGREPAGFKDCVTRTHSVKDPR
jgi:hypothetical protein